jgi:tRNA(Ile)-lysidine synthetase-like protein
MEYNSEKEKINEATTFSSNIYIEIVSFWFENKKYWFCCPPDFDNLITNKYKNILDLQLYLNLEFYLDLDAYHLLGKIILIDQFSRHIYRNDSSKIKMFDAIALQLLKKYDQNIESMKLMAEERCFLIMPYRHTFQESYLIKCIQLINTWKIDNYHPIYRRFYQVTLKSLIKINNEKDMLYTNYKNIKLTDINSVLDSNSSFDLKKIIKNDININENKMYKEFVKNIVGYHKIYVSVSGGVDSMVCLYLLHIYKQKNPTFNLEIGAISINYNNRDEQHIELFMVSEFCKYLGIDYYVREITEITRTRDSDRELYESITREIRFDAYKKIINCPIILGHNMDDCLENIFVNLKNKAKYNNLLGMEIKSMERDVTILRPILNINKVDIIEFAQKCNIPYIYDSTCKWSNRGKLRDILMPAINDFDSAILPNLVTFIKNYNEIYKIYEKSIDKIDYYENYCIIDNSNGIIFFEYFKKIFTMICMKYNIRFIKNKAIEYLIECIQKDLKNKITLSKNVIAKKTGNNIKVFISM